MSVRAAGQRVVQILDGAFPPSSLAGDCIGKLKAALAADPLGPALDELLDAAGEAHLALGVEHAAAVRLLTAISGVSKLLPPKVPS